MRRFIVGGSAMASAAIEYSQSLTQQEIEDFLQAEAEEGHSVSTIKRHRCDLHKLQRYLGASGVIQPGTLLAWQNEMHEQGYALNTICACITTANLYLTHKGKPGLCQPRPHYEERPDSTLTKAEYFQLLQTARAQGLLREEMLLRLLVETDLQLQSLPQVTVEAFWAGRVTQAGQNACVIVLPPALQSGLQKFAKQAGIRSGPLFILRTGVPLHRANVTLLLQKLASRASVPLEKVSPRSLQKIDIGGKQTGNLQPAIPFKVAEGAAESI